MGRKYIIFIMFLGRDDLQAYCILYYGLPDLFRQSTMVMTEQTGIEKLYGMIAYAINNTWY